jgi:hypothetical protein
MAQYSQDEMVHAATAIAEAMNRLNKKVEALEAKPAYDRFTADVAENHEFLRGRGLSAEQISKGEERMVARSNGNYADAFRLGYFGQGKPVIGGIPADRLAKMMSGDSADLDAITDELTEEALADCRGYRR